MRPLSESVRRLRRCILVTVLAAAWTAAPAHAQWVITPHLGANVAGDVELAKGGPGVSVGYFGGPLGLEFDLQRYQHFFKDSRVSPLDYSEDYGFWRVTPWGLPSDSRDSCRTVQHRTCLRRSRRACVEILATYAKSGGTDFDPIYFF
jgi:hypothetical protein